MGEGGRIFILYAYCRVGGVITISPQHVGTPALRVNFAIDVSDCIPKTLTSLR